ncbi:hypothetical protein [Aliivibrio fischeri]|uniref:hypothetical protein n=1 Tax=Aliivibrio fischeri TaxID=668 RepID=UPI0015B71951|nr:hypothetical protein [Aliivibrio fischeri]
MMMSNERYVILEVLTRNELRKIRCHPSDIKRLLNNIGFYQGYLITEPENELTRFKMF